MKKILLFFLLCIASGLQAMEVTSDGDNRLALKKVRIALANRDFDSIASLVLAGADPNVVVNGMTLLYLAVSRNQVACINVLLEMGADPHKTSNYYTPLYHAVEGKDLESATALLQARACPLEMISGSTLMDVACCAYYMVVR